MRGTWLRTALLAAAVAALALFVYLKPATVTGEHALSTVKAETASTIRLERPRKEPIVLERRGEVWFLTAPVAARAEPLQVQRLLAIAEAKSRVRLAAADLARFELERPAARVTIDAQTFDFGIVNDVSREQYVLTGGTVYTVSPRYGAALPATPGDLIARQLLGSNEVPVRIELSEFTITSDGGKWVLTPAAGDPSQDDLQRWVDDWRNASALRVEPYGMGTPVAEVKMQFRDGTALSVGVLSRGPDAALLRPDQKLVYYLSSGAAKRLFSPPAPKN